MREFDDITHCIKEGSLFKIIGKNDGIKFSYYGYLTEYDGDMISEVKNIKIAKFLCQYRYIMNNIDQEKTFKLSYDRECRIYVSTITNSKITDESYIVTDKNMDNCIYRLNETLYNKEKSKIKIRNITLGEKNGK